MAVSIVLDFRAIFSIPFQFSPAKQQLQVLTYTWYNYQNIEIEYVIDYMHQ